MPEITDNDLIQMLRCCGKDDESADCGHCPVADYGCAGAFLRTADRLEKLVAENEALKTKLWPEYCQDMAEYSCPRVVQLRQEIDHLREVTKMIGKDNNVPAKWVSVNERLPEDKQDVLAVSNDGEEIRVYPANYDKGKWFDCFFLERNKHTTHWMPLPKPPSTEEVE